MTLNEIVTAVIAFLAIVVPSFITILTLLKKNYVNKSINGIKKLMSEGFQSNSDQHVLIKATLIKHTDSILKLLQDKTIAARLTLVARHAILFCGNKLSSKLLQSFISEFIFFVQDVTDIGFENTNKLQILTKLSMARDNNNTYAKTVISTERVLKWHMHITPLVLKYLKDVYDIYDDVVNNKNSRFLVKSEDFAQSVVRLFINFHADLNLQKL